MILTAVELEARAIAGIWGLSKPTPGQPARTDSIELAIEIYLVGIRALHMPLKLHDQPVLGIIMAGLAGALEPSLNIGDIVIDDCPTAILPGIAFHRGKIHASSEIVSTPKRKASLFRQTHALAVDMESAVARSAAADLGIPFVSIRAISDTAADYLDPAVLKMVDAFGRPKLAAIAGTLIHRPWLIPQLTRLRKNSQVAAANLATAVADIVKLWSGSEMVRAGE